MRMIHFNDPQNVEKNYDWLWDVKARYMELRDMGQYCDRCTGTSSTVWVTIKRRLLAFIQKKRL